MLQRFNLEILGAVCFSRCLYLAVRSGDWYLRTAALKEMAPLITCYDHFTYRKLIAQHVADILCYPAEVLCAFKQGAFVVSIMGHERHCVGVDDEAHEMLINRACKTSIVHPSKGYITRISNYLLYRTRCIQNIKKELQLENNAQKSEKSGGTPSSLAVSSGFQPMLGLLPLHP